jgi:ketosteroid isomerase-like protein
MEAPMRQLSALIVIAILLLPLACAPKPVDMAALRKTVDDFNNASKEAMLSGNSDKVMTYYEADALEMAPNSPVFKGKDNILAFEQQMMKSGMKFNAVEFQTLELTADGKIAYEIGSYNMTITMPPMGEVKDAGKYIALWRQQADGSWKVHAETWNTDMPMPPPPTAKEEKGKKK